MSGLFVASVRRIESTSCRISAGHRSGNGSYLHKGTSLAMVRTCAGMLAIVAQCWNERGRQETRPRILKSENRALMLAGLTGNH